MSDKPNVNDVWTKRWNGLRIYLENLIDNLEGSEPFPRQDSIVNTLKCLRAFGESQFQFFHQGFTSGSNVGTADYPAEYALATTLDQISYDITVLERAANQRFSSNQTLETADKLAYQALFPILPLSDKGLENARETRKLILEEPTTVLTYFQKSSSVRIIPYAPIVLIGIPYSTQSTNRDFLAIPHEVAHYIYRYGRVTVEGFHNFWVGSEFSKLAEQYKGWFEEIFADVYGALVAGPAIALSFQDLQMAKSTQVFFQNDGEHPVPVIRPYIYINAIESRQDDQLNFWTDKLRKNWKPLLEKRRDRLNELLDNDKGHSRKKEEMITHANDEYFEKLLTTAEPLNRQSKKVLDKVVNSILIYLFKNIKPSSWAIDYSPAGKNISIDSLYTRTEKYIEAVAADIPELRVSEGRMFMQEQMLERAVGETRIQKVEANKNKERNKVTDDGWLAVLDAGGWNVKGPDCEGSGLC